MADEPNRQVEALVFTGENGELYAVPVELLDQLRVPEDRRAELEQALAAGQDDD